MAHLIKIKDNHVGYVDIVKYLMENGTKQNSRNGNTIELEDVVIEVENPTLTALDGVRPFYGPEIGLVEGLQLVAGISDSALTAQIQPNFRNYMEDDTGKFWGAYGPRVIDQLPIIVERLREDPDTRQAVITLWDPEFDAKGGKKDHPCTSLFNFRIRDGKLNMSTYMRSNDAIWGWPFDLIQFSMLMQSVAHALKVEVGTYTHHVGSFHIYEPHWGIAQDIIDLKHGIGKVFYIPSFFEWGEWESIRACAFRVYRVITQTLSWKDAWMFGIPRDELTITKMLLAKRAQQLEKVLDAFEP